MRIDGFEQGLREARKFGVELEVNAGGEPGEAFEQTFDVGIGTNLFGIAVEGETAGNLGVLASKFARHFAQVTEFGIVEI